MKLTEYLKTAPHPQINSTLCFLLKENQVLLAMKKRGFGSGKWNGIGGKKETQESIDETARRETREEIGVDVKELYPMATLEFYFPHKPQWSQQVTVFVTKEWTGTPIETEEMAPQWYDFTKIPYENMWPDDRVWLPEILTNKKVTAQFIFDNNESILDFQLETFTE